MKLVYVILLGAFLSACAPQYRSGLEPRVFGGAHPGYEEFEALLARRASRAEVERTLVTALRSRPVGVSDQAALKKAVPAGIEPTKRALQMVARRPDAVFSQMIDDVRVLACFDGEGRLVEYTLF